VDYPAAACNPRQGVVPSKPQQTMDSVWTTIARTELGIASYLDHSLDSSP